MIQKFTVLLQGVQIWLALIALTSAADDAEECTTCIKVDTSCFNLTYMFDLNAPFRNKVVIPKMAIMRSVNMLIYSFEPNITDPEYYKVAFVNVDDPKIFGVISADKRTFNFGAFDIDQDNQRIYLGGSNGIFLLNTNGYTLEPYSSFGDTIISLFYQRYVYFVRYGENRIFQKKGDEFIPYINESSITNFVITKHYAVVFQTTSGLFVTKNGNTHKLSDNPFYKGLAIDLDGAVYTWYLEQVYKIVIKEVLSKSKIHKVADVPGLGTMTFDNRNNIIFNADRSLYRLSPTADGTTC